MCWNSFPKEFMMSRGPQDRTIFAVLTVFRTMSCSNKAFALSHVKVSSLISAYIFIQPRCNVSHLSFRILTLSIFAILS